MRNMSRESSVEGFITNKQRVPRIRARLAEKTIRVSSAAAKSHHWKMGS